MNSERWNKLQELFEGASQLPASEQLPFVRNGAGEDAEISDQVIRMLERDAKASFLDCSIQTLASELFDEFELSTLETVKGAGLDREIGERDVYSPNGFPQKIGPYYLLKELGAGGMGVVYLAERLEWKKGNRPFRVALKVPRDVWISSDRLKRFGDEQRLLAQLVHPAIARIYEGGTLSGGMPWFAMEFVDGEPITRFCKARASSLPERLELVLRVCEAVQYAHRQAIIHRDLKPSNILITSAGEVKLLDFGIAKEIGESIPLATSTRVGLHPMTLSYAAPEQILQNQISTQTDVYSIGVILYELLTGRLPFDLSRFSTAQLEQFIRTEEPERPSLAAGAGSQRREWLDLDLLVQTAIHKDTAKRYASVDALSRDIIHYLKNEPLEARPDSFAYRSSKFLQRRRLPVLLSAAALMLIIGLIAFYTASLAKARDAALAEANRTRSARQFTADLLEGGDSEAGPSKDLRVIDLLQPGLEKAKHLQGDPIQQAQLFTTLGSLFVNFGDFHQGDAALHSAYRLLTKAGAVKSHEFSEVLIQLGLMYAAEGHPDHALVCLRKGLATEQQIVPRDEGLVYKYKTAVANVLVDMDPKTAIVTLKDLLKERSPAIDEEKQSDVWDLLATAYLDVGDYQNAEPFAQRVLAYTRKTRPHIHPDLATELVNLGMIQLDLGQYAARDKTLREALAIDEAWYPKGHGETADVKRMLAETLYYEKRYEEAAVLAREALADEQKTYGTIHKRVAYALQVAGRIALERGFLDEAEADIRLEIPILRALKDQNNLPVALSCLGDVYKQQHKYQLAVGAYQEALALFPNDALEHSRQSAKTERNLSDAQQHLAE